MATLDWVFAGVLLASLLLGAWRGLVYEVLSVVAWIAAFILAQWFAPDVAPRLPMGNAGEGVRYLAAFLVVFVGVVFAGALVAWLVKKAVEAVGLRPVDRMLGAAFGLARGVLIVLAIAVVANMTPLRDAGEWMDSKGAAAATAALVQLKPVMPERFGRYLPG